ncbi:DsbC family protein [Comamonas jiangduensis]|uniref:DsbC family protein n=1 Tax=Comamonas jiangduensis TaxID=1194168 RepID=UPI003BF87DC7
MNTKLKTLLALLLIAGTANAQTVSKQPLPLTSQQLKAAVLAAPNPSVVTQAGTTLEFDASQGSVDKIVSLTSGIKAIEAAGQIYFVSENGRYIITGQVVDVWQRKTLATMSEIEKSSNRIFLDAFGMDFSQLNTIQLGKVGAPMLTIITDPKCPICHKQLTEALKLKDKYRLNVIVVPALGKESHTEARSLFCAEDKSKAIDYLMQNRLRAMKQKSACDIANYDKTLYFADYIGVKGVPLLIAPDGRVHKGYNAQLDAWMKGDK